MKKNIIKFFLILFLSSSAMQAIAQDSFVISDIRIKGLQKLDVGTIYNYLPLKIGDDANQADLRSSIQQLFQTGFFDDVSLSQEGSILVVDVVERPSIASVSLNGNVVLTSENIRTGLEDAGLVEGRILNPVVLSRVRNDLEKVYLDLGRYSATVETEVSELERNRVAVAFNITEGKVAKIKKINILGVEQVKLSQLRDVMLLKTKRGLRFFSRQDQYSKQKLEADLERITSFYQNRGFNNFRIVSSNVEISPNKQDIFINITVDEGEVFTAGSYRVEGVNPERANELAELVTIRADEPYSQLDANVSQSAISAAMADEGYAFVDVRVILTTNLETRVIDTLFSVVPNTRVYVRRINISGNLLTRDEVIRRELRQFESAWYSAIDISQSQNRLRRLGLFQTVTIDSTPVPGTTDQVDLDIVVEEFSTGSIDFSLGYSETYKGQYGITFKQKNLLGTGKDLSIAATKSRANQTIRLAYTNPFYTQSGISRSFVFNFEKFDSANVGTTVSYLTDTSSVGVFYNIPIAETNTLNVGIQYEQLDLKPTSTTPSNIAAEIARNPRLKNGIFTLGVAKDTRNDAFFPTSGGYASTNVELSVPGSESTYYRLGVQGSYYQPLSEVKKVSLKGSAQLGYGDGYGDLNTLPFYKNYYAGGPESVRGFDVNSLGPRDGNRALGGNKLVLTSVELGLPPFGSAGSQDKQLGFFVDSGMVYASTEALNLSKLRHSAGIFFNWYSNIGPFSMSYGSPLKKEAGDSVQRFQLSLGATF